MLPLDYAATAGFALALTSRHGIGFRSRRWLAALCRRARSYLRSLGGDVFTGTQNHRYARVTTARARLFDVVAASVAVDRRRSRARAVRTRRREFRYGPGVFKIDWPSTAGAVARP
jgi:hypothetical protein